MAARASKATKRTRPRRGRAAERRPHLLRTLLGTAVLVAAGFAVGLFAGALWETPSTLLGPFRGEAEVVDLSPLAEPTGTAQAPEGEAPGPIERALEAQPEPETPPSVAAGPPLPSGPFAIQVGSFEEPVPAWKLAEELGEKEYEVYVDEGQAAGRPRWRVRVGPVTDRDQADRLARRLKADERLPTWIVVAEKRG